MTDYSSSPKDADPEKLKNLCGALVEGERSVEELYDQLDMGDSLVNDTLRYGERLGFIERLDDGVVKNTNRGTKWHYANEGTDNATNLFKDGITEYVLYKELLMELSYDLEDNTDEFAINQSSVVQLFRTEFGFTLAESSLSDGANTFLKTLEAAGFGNYVIGRRGKETRLESNEELLAFVEGIEGQAATIGSEDGDMKEEELEGDDNKRSNDPDGTNLAEETQTNNVTDSATGQLRLELAIDGSDDPENVYRLLVSIRKALESPIEDLPSFSFSSDVERSDESNQSLLEFRDAENEDN